ncbi:MAG: helix-turn-helix domain-containing protein [Lachnospiraceae bacterium]
MKTTNAFSHLTLEERRIILTGITNNSTKTAIAQTIGKDKSTVGKEIKLHRVLTHKCKMPLECNNYRKCTFGRNCTLDCPEYSSFPLLQA